MIFIAHNVRSKEYVGVGSYVIDVVLHSSKDTTRKHALTTNTHAGSRDGGTDEFRFHSVAYLFFSLCVKSGVLDTQ